MVRWKYLKRMIWKPCIYNIFVGSQEAELKWLPLFQKRFLRVNKAQAEDVENYCSYATLFICVFIYFVIYIFHWSLNPSDLSEKDTFTVTSSSSPPLPVGSVGLNGTGFYMFVPFRDGFWCGWEFPPLDEEEGKAATLCSEPTCAAASACGRRGWVGHCSPLRGGMESWLLLRSWHLPQVTLSTDKAVLFFGQRCQQVRGIQLMLQVSIGFILEECSMVSDIYHFDFSSSFFFL